MARILRTPLAQQDYRDIWQYIAADNHDAADRLLRTIDTKLALYAERPGMGTARGRLSPGLRSFPVGKYLVFYRPIESGIELVRVLHGSRRIAPHFRRKP